MSFLPLLVSVAFADPPEPAPAAPAPPAPSNVPVLSALTGTWFAVSTVDGRSVVDWACAARPTSIELESDFVMVAAAESAGGAISASNPRGDALVLQTTVAACKAPKEISLRWADPEHHLLEITRCEGAPRVLRTVRDRSAGVPVMRQCCDPSGRMVSRVDIDSACPTGSTGQKPEPLH